MWSLLSVSPSFWGSRRFGEQGKGGIGRLSLGQKNLEVFFLQIFNRKLIKEHWSVHREGIL